MFDNNILKDITVVNKWLNPQTKENEYKINHVKGFWSSNDSISISNTDLIKNDGLKAIIFMSEKGYVNPKIFQKDGNGWTLKNDDYLIKGVVNVVKSIAEIKDNYETMKITNVAIKDYGSLDMQHFEINGE